MPGSLDDVYCDDHVPRGCACQMNDDDSMQLDDQDRELPCVEYDFDERGFYIKEL